MADNQSSTAIGLMRMALALLERDGNQPASIQLQRAIDLAVEPPVRITEREIEEVFAG